MKFKTWRWGQILIFLSLLCGGTSATPAWAQTAVPFYQTDQWVYSMKMHAMLPKAQRFEKASQILESELQKNNACEGAALQTTRSAWSQAVSAWDDLSAVATGPLVERRSARRIDFQPSRPALIERAVQQSPSDVEALEAIGAPAKGLPALEWLLWAAPKKQAVCAYAHVLALEVLDEAQALQAGFAKDTAAESNEAATAQAAEAFLNQWVGGVEMLRWRYLGKPLESASARKSPEFVHALSGHTVQTWTAQWASLRDFARWPNDKDKGARPPGADIEHPTEALIPLSLYLQGRGLLDLAHRLDVALAKADAAVAKLQPAQPKTLRAAISSLGALRQLVETDVAAAMQVNMGFSDADGD